MTDMERFIEAADALAGALSESRETHCGIAEHILQQGPRANRRAIFADSQRARLAIDKAQTEYRAAREAITKGTPPARECLHPYCGDVCGQEPEEDRDAYNLRVYGLREEDLP